MRPWWSLRLAELIDYREILYVFAWRNITTRYRQMLLGILWSVLEPLAFLLMMVAVFGYFLKLPTDGYPYPVFVFAGLVPWLLFNRATNSCAESLVANMHIISKIYFPRMILPLSAMSKDILDAAIMVLLLFGFTFAYGFPSEWKLLTLPFFLLIAVLTALAIGLWISGPMVRFRDLRYVLAIVLQLGMYGTPIIYSASVVPESILTVYKLNPMYWAVEGCRWVLLGRPLAMTSEFYASIAGVLVLLISGLFVFSVFERMSVDVQ